MQKTGPSSYHPTHFPSPSCTLMKKTWTYRCKKKSQSMYRAMNHGHQLLVNGDWNGLMLSRLFFLFLLLRECSSQGDAFALELVDHNRQVVGSTVVFQYTFAAENLPTCSSAESCDFRASLHGVSPIGTCQTEDLSDADETLVVQSKLTNASGIEAEVVFDILQASTAFLQSAVTDSTLQFCLRLESYDQTGQLAEFLQTISRTGISLYGNFSTTDSGSQLSTGAFGTINEGLASDTFTVPIIAGSCPGAELVQVTETGVFMQVCIASTDEFFIVQSISQASVQRTTTGATQTVIENAQVLEPLTTTISCVSNLCDLRFLLDPVALGTEGGTIRFFGAAVVGGSGGQRKLDDHQHSERIESSFEYTFELALDLQDATSASRVLHFTAVWLWLAFAATFSCGF